MSNHREDIGIIEAILERLNEFRLPRLLELKGRVDRGEAISDNDVEFLERVLHDAHSIHPLIDRNPEMHPVYAQLTELYAEITEKAVENEGKAQS